jgi:hypothetical protein
VVARRVGVREDFCGPKAERGRRNPERTAELLAERLA